ncbi:MAG TPA: preprotein translocase subunit SecG [Candidatus Eisenbacteria bacterium]|uniref:Protein-export membrane protein SecG n=1 Tax=Eiseniibacteriota bacterium TaxID=2212470 RepID=A0A7V2F3S0_UNCEI|nr:preprotein translocase subunit SecG [Candidatus Eisenbacteria bacterium]
MLFTIFVILHVITCFLLIVVVLMQSSKGGGLSGAFGGGGGGEAMFGGRETATFLSKSTTYLAIIFMVTSLSLAFLSADHGAGEAESVLRKAAQRGERIETVVPEEQKDIEEVLGTLPEPAQTGQEGQTEKAPE